MSRIPSAAAPLTALAAAALLAACSTTPMPSTSAAEVGEVRPGSGYLNGYLPESERPDSLALVLPPPQASDWP